MSDVKTRWFQFHQNNSGGRFEGPAAHVVVEAVDADHANARAEKVGLYFNGCASGQDCSCCGDRWYPASGSGDAVPMVYDRPADLAEKPKAGRDEACSREAGAHLFLVPLERAS